MLLVPTVKDIIHGVDTSVVSGYLAKLYIDKTGSGNQNWIVPFLANKWRIYHFNDIYNNYNVQYFAANSSHYVSIPLRQQTHLVVCDV